MDQASQRELKILTEIAERDSITQRDLSKSLGIALGLTNLYLKRLARKGYLKATTIPPKRLKYLITPQGIVEKSRLTYEYLTLSLALYKETRAALSAVLRPLVKDGVKHFALVGVGEAAELAYLTLREFGVEPVAVYADAGGGSFLGLPVRAKEELAGARCDRVVVASFGPMGDQELADLLRLVPRDKVILLGRDGA
jgi:DNA-binding MarR family transcriptional regulator